MKQKEQFETKDLWLASALTILLKTQPDYRVENGQVVFAFPKSEALYKSLSDYNSGCALPVYEYAQVVKRLRAEMLLRRGMKRA